MVRLSELKPKTREIVRRTVLATASRRPKTKVLINPTQTQTQNQVEVEND
jgi:hypothetical protein